MISITNDIYEIYSTSFNNPEISDEKESLIERQKVGILSKTAVTINLTKACIGAGFLAYSYNAYNGGMLSVLFLLPAAACMSLFCSVIVSWSIEELEKSSEVRITSLEDLMLVKFVF